ncbi:hypothetical protein GCM10010492_54880 [Saccharothrix mutabilis subsp. mutabilis]|uniref:Uncharacterized protein n=1 Tax=Saccharothrix mutabilis subsp. mutabilis TaxID=66855 RepID=A0ABN0UEQ1_9PSEU
MRTATLLRTGIIVLALWQAGPALWAVVSPEGFYWAFPTPDHAWVSAHPPYNEHLVRDLGLAALQLVPVAAVCVKWPQPVFVRAVLIASLVFSLPHMVYHETHVAHTHDLLWQRAALWFPILLAISLLPLTRARAKEPVRP